MSVCTPWSLPTRAGGPNKGGIEEAGQGEDAVRELHAEVVPGDVHEGVRGRHDAHAVMAPQDVHHKAVPERRPHLRIHTDRRPVSSMASCISNTEPSRHGISDDRPHLSYGCNISVFEHHGAGDITTCHGVVAGSSFLNTRR